MDQTKIEQAFESILSALQGLQGASIQVNAVFTDTLKQLAALATDVTNLYEKFNEFKHETNRTMQRLEHLVDKSD